MSMSETGVGRSERFHCTECGTALTRPVIRLPGVPQPRPEVNDEDRTEQTIPVGHWAFDAEPAGWVPREDLPYDPDAIPGIANSRPFGTWNCPVLNAADLLDLPSHPNPGRSSGCCGRAGVDGPNVICPTCAVPVATMMDDCHTPQEVRLLPKRVIAYPVT